MDYSITDEHVNDAKEGINIIKGIKNRVSRLFWDKGHDSKAIYNEIEESSNALGKNASTISRGLFYRAKITGFFHRFNEELWKMKNGYGLRWNIEIYFPGIKILFNEVIRTVKPENIVRK